MLYHSYKLIFLKELSLLTCKLFWKIKLRKLLALSSFMLLLDFLKFTSEQ